MKRTLTVQIGGRGFTIDEDAWVELKGYIKRLGLRVPVDEREDVIMDIESRIAEYFWEWKGSHGMVVSLAEVLRVESIIGEASDMGDPQAASGRSAYTSRTGHRKLYRDGRDRVFGGVCSGLGYFFNLDPLVFRLLFGVGLFLVGGSFWVYIILWIAVPKAITRAQRLEMMGLPRTPDNLSRDI